MAKFAPQGATPQVASVGSAPSQAMLDISSTPSGAEIEVDGSFVGNAPSSLGVAPGEHTIKLTKTGYTAWEKKIRTSSGQVKLAAELQAVGATEQKQDAKVEQK